MSDLLQCDFPSCVIRSQRINEWTRVEALPKWTWLCLAIPFIGNLICLFMFIIPDRYSVSTKHLCPEHSKQMFPGFSN